MIAMATRWSVLFALLSCSVQALAQDNYATFELRRQDNWGPLRFADVDGDGASDVAVPYYDPALGRELHIYRQQANGSFATEPQRIEIKTEIVAVDFADVRAAPGEELILFAGAGVFSLSASQAGYTDNLKLLFEWPLLAGIPDHDAVRFTNLATDINGDGHVDFLMPGDDVYGVFLGQGEERYLQAASLSTLNEGMTPVQRRNLETDLDAELSINAEQGVVIDLRVQTPTPFSGFVRQWRDGEEQPAALLESEQWMPSPVLAQLDDDGLADLVYINAGDNGLGKMNIHFQSADGEFSDQADWQGQLDSSGEMSLTDIDGDGLADLMRVSGEGQNWTARFYRNRGGRFDFAQPNQVMRFSGYDARFEVLRLEEQAPPVLSVTYYTIPVVEAIRNASINRVQLIYASSAGSDTLFAARPASRLEESFSADNVRGLSEQMSLRFDVDGNGRKDALYITENGTLAARRIDADLQIERTPFWEYVSPRSIFQFQVLTLNDDAIPDLLLRHGTTTTLLLGRP